MKSFGRPSRSNGAQLLQIHVRAQLHGCIYVVFVVALVALVRFMRFLVALLVGCSSPVCNISFLASRCYIMWIHVMWRHIAWVISRQSWTSPDQKGTDLIAGKHETPRPRCDSVLSSVLKCPKKALWWVPKSLDMHHFRNRNHPKDPQRFSRLICLRNMRAFFIGVSPTINWGTADWRCSGWDLWTDYWKRLLVAAFGWPDECKCSLRAWWE